MCSHYGKQCGGSSENEKVELPHDPEILPLVLYSKEMKSISQRDKGTPMSTAVLSTELKARKQQGMDGLQMWHNTYTMEFYSP